MEWSTHELILLQHCCICLSYFLSGYIWYWFSVGWTRYHITRWTCSWWIRW